MNAARGMIVRGDNTVHVIVPHGIDDPARPSGGNLYDRRICDGLAARGWSVHEHAVPGDWPSPDAAARSALAAVLTGLAEGAVVVIDGLIASAAGGLPAFARRLLVVVLVHMPLAQGCDSRAETSAVEEAVLSAAAAVVATSAWTKDWLIGHYALTPERIHVIEPGTDAAELAPGTAGGGGLLCVAAVTPAKGHDVLVAALTEVGDLPWACVCAGAVDLDPGFVGRLCDDVRSGGLDGRVRFVGARAGVDLDAAYAAADVVVLCSRAETYGMVVTEALARGVPVIASAVGGVPEALGGSAPGNGAGMVRPGILVPPEDPHALATALRQWLGDADLRLRLRWAARQRRTQLPAWASAAGRFSDVLAGVAPGRGSAAHG